MSASAGRVLIIPKGDYDSSVTYNMLDMVYYGGKSYICKQTSTGNDPTNTVYWQIMLDGATSFDDLTDVQINNVQDGDSIYWDGTAQKWKNTTPTSIAVTTPPAKTEYTVGDILDLTGIVVTAYYTGGSTRNITSLCTFSPANGATLSTSDSSVTVTWGSFTTSQAISVTNPIFGVEWDGSSSPAWTRTDDAVGFTDPVTYYNGITDTPSSPFDNIMPWAGMVDYTDSNGNKFVAIPKFYYKWTKSGSSMKLQIAKGAETGFHVSPAHKRGNTEYDVVYVSKYSAGRNNDDVPVSVSGIYNQVYFTNTGTYSMEYYRGVMPTRTYFWDYAMYWTLVMLYLVENASWLPTYGDGSELPSDTNPNAGKSGYTDSIPYHSGVVNGQSQKSRVLYRNIEDFFWDKGSFILDGFFFSGLNNRLVSITSDPDDFGIGDKQVQVYNMNNAPSNGLITSFTDEQNIDGLEYAIFPYTSITDSNQYYETYCCGIWSRTGNSFIVGSVESVGLAGSRFIGFNPTAFSSGRYQPTRLMKLPAIS